MSPEACRILMDEIVPIVQSVIPRLRLVGCDDHQELEQDCVTSAAQMLDSAERAGKPLMGKSTAFYAIQRCKVGRRSTSGNRTDAMAPSTQLDGLATVVSMEEPVTHNADEDNLSIGDMLAASGDDPCVLAAKHLDWQGYMADMDPRDVLIITSTAEGESAVDLAERLKVSTPRITQRKRSIGKILYKKSGGQVMRDATSRPLWNGNLVAGRERTLRWKDLDGKPASLVAMTRVICGDDVDVNGAGGGNGSVEAA